MTASGIMHSEETILVDAITFWRSAPSEVQAIWASQMAVKTNKKTESDDLCILDTVGDNANAYDDERSEDGQQLDDEPRLFPCLAWGLRKRVSYSIHLSHAMSVSVAFDVVVVPTSWWVDVCQGTYWVIQIVDATQPLPQEGPVSISARSIGFEVVGWATAREDEKEGEDA